MAIKTISRRHFLMGLGGSFVPIPFLSSLSNKAEAQTDPQLRFVSLRTIYGQLPQLYYPEQRPTQQIDEHVYFRELAVNEKISPIIGDAFRPVAHKLSLLRGIDESYGTHNHTTMLAPGKHGGENDPNPETSTSMDELVARSSLYDVAPPFRSIRVAPHLKTFDYSWYKGERQPYDRNMPALFDKMAKFAVNDNPGEVNPEIVKALKAVDLAKPSYDSLRSSNKMSNDDKNRLNDYLDMLTDLETKLDGIKNLAACSMPEINDSDKSAEFDAANDLVVAALACDMTRVASFSMATWGSVSGERASDFHGESHWIYGKDEARRIIGPRGPEYLVENKGSNDENELQRFYSWPANKVASLMTKMDQVVESNGKTLLDNSIVYWGNELSGGFAHSGISQPIVVAGTAHGKFKPGYWDFTHNPFLFYANRLDTMLPAGSVAYNNFLVTLMHALGLQESEWESVDGGAGFGGFKIGQYNFQGKNSNGNTVKMKGDQLYAAFIKDDAAKRRTIPYWYVG